MNGVRNLVETGLLMTAILAASCSSPAIASSRSALEGIGTQSVMAAASNAPAECIPLPNASGEKNPAGFPLCDGTPINPDLSIATQYDGIGSSGFDLTADEMQLGHDRALNFQTLNPNVFGDDVPFATKWDFIENNGARKPVLYVRGGEKASYKGHNIEGRVTAVVTYDDTDQPKIFYFPFEKEELGKLFDTDEAVLRVDADGQARVWGNDTSKYLAEIKNDQGTFSWSIQ
jgi:hypothetical protein